MVMEKGEAEQKRDIAAKKRLLAQKRARVGELDNLFDRVYEDHVAGKLNEEQFTRMSGKYAQEQKTIRSEIAELEKVVSGQEEQLGDVSKFLGVVRKYTEIQELSPAITNEFIDKIIVYEPEKARGNRIQRVEIIYNGVGAVDIPQSNKSTGA
jgi:hypothetical protein